VFQSPSAIQTTRLSEVGRVPDKNKYHFIKNTSELIAGTRVNTYFPLFNFYRLSFLRKAWERGWGLDIFNGGQSSFACHSE
jgi:hypothetical protein